MQTFVDLNTSTASSSTPDTSRTIKHERLDELESIGTFNHDEDDGPSKGKLGQGDEVFDKYSLIYTSTDLPIALSERQILDTIDKNPVIVLQGATGCGKSTQVPKFILNQSFTRKEYCNIIVTQPRRIAARSIAQRVALECNWELGKVIGYQVGLNTVSHEDTRVLFCTTGVLLEKLIRTKTMVNYTHIILDEVHERDQDMDFLFIVIRRLLATNSPKTKVILMSATIEAPLFADYFKIPRRNGIAQPAPIISVEPKQKFTVRNFYLCQLSGLKLVKLFVVFVRIFAEF